jgi:hypothetical protein
MHLRDALSTRDEAKAAQQQGPALHRLITRDLKGGLAEY